MTPPKLRTGFTLSRTTPFSYKCNACSRCCRGKVIPINPHEVAHLARALGVSTTEVLARYTETGGATLAHGDGGDACVFLTERGCGVHDARPLACRLYPLGRHTLPSGEESFAEMEPHPETAGEYGKDGTVDDFLRAQDTGPFVRATDRYFVVLRRMLDALSKREDRADVSDAATEAMRHAPRDGDDNVLDMDPMVERYCAERGLAVPSDVEEKTELHLRALEAFVDGL
jgi:Fe-S-cluster containining protein